MYNLLRRAAVRVAHEVDILRRFLALSRDEVREVIARSPRTGWDASLAELAVI